MRSKFSKSGGTAELVKCMPKTRGIIIVITTMIWFMGQITIKQVLS